MDEDNISEECVQLGILKKSKNKLFQNKNWNTWDGGKVGGEPIWLTQSAIPSTNQLNCQICSLPMKFLLQIYCPLDEPESAFHRCLYLFTCRKTSCVLKGSVKCFRSQLSRRNPYYDYEGISNKSTNEHTPDSTKVISENTSKCAVCSETGKFKCSNCHLVSYCGKEHQKQDWKSHKILCKQHTSAESITSISSNNIVDKKDVFPEYSLVVEDEIIIDDTSKTTNTSAKKALQSDITNIDKFKDKEIVIDNTVIKPEVWVQPNDNTMEDDYDEEETQDNYNQAAGLDKTDPIYDAFLSRIRKGNPKQVLRYDRWPPIEHSSITNITNTTTTNTTTTTQIEESMSYSRGPLLITSQAYQSMRNYRLYTTATNIIHNADITQQNDREKNTSISTSSSSLSPSTSTSTSTSSSIVNYNPADSVHVNTCMRCTYCQSIKKFEFQVMPQLLYYLGVDKQTSLQTKKPTITTTVDTQLKTIQLFQNNLDEDIDFGTLDIYTCPNSCQNAVSENCLDSLMEETVFVIPPPPRDATRIPTHMT